MKNIFRIICLSVIVLITSTVYGNKKDCKYIKRKYPETHHAIKEWANRKAPANDKLQTDLLHMQCKAFRILADKWNENKGKDRQIIQHALLRWGWLSEDSFPNTDAIVNYHLVYMEYRQKTDL